MGDHDTTRDVMGEQASESVPLDQLRPCYLSDLSVATHQLSLARERITYLEDGIRQLLFKGAKWVHQDYVHVSELRRLLGDDRG